MKNATNRIIEQIPVVKDHLEEKNMNLIPLDDQTKIFLELAQFFENPKEKHFSLERLYQQLDNDWLELALESIHVFFTKDTYLIQKPTHSLITDQEEYLNQSRFVKFLKKVLA